MSEAYSTCGTLVYIAQDFGQWVELKGYAGGLTFGMSTSPAQREGDDDGITRYFKGGSTGAASQLAFRTIDDDPGQELILQMGGLEHDGLGYVKTVRPQGGEIIAEGIFLGAVGNMWDGLAFQGHTVTFMQHEPETYDL